MSDIPFFAGRAAFALRVRQLVNILYEQMDDSLAAHGLRLPSYTTGLVQTLFHNGDQSLTGLADDLGLSHQLASQRVRWLVRHDLAVIEDDRADRRRRRVALTEAGRAEAQRLQEFLPRLEQAYGDLFDEIGIDLHRGVLDATAAMQARTLRQRLGAPAGDRASGAAGLR